MIRPTKKHDALRRHPALADFDEQLWPINLVLLVLAGFITGIIVAKGDFHTPALIHNGYCQLVVLAMIVGAFAWGIVRLDGRLQRRLQFGVFMSLLVHFCLCIFSYNVYLSLMPVAQRDAEDQFEEPQPVTLPDYHWQDERQDVMVDETLESPVETETPEVAPQPVERAETEPAPIKRPSETEPAAPQREPSEVEIERAELTAPRRSERLAGERMSRSESSARQPAEQVEAPQMAEAPKQPAPVDAQVKAVERQATRAQVERRESNDQPATKSAPDAARMVRRENSPRRTSSAAPATPTKQLATLPKLSPTSVDQPAGAPSQSEPTSELAPSAAAMTRQATNPALARSTPAAEANAARPNVGAAAPRRAEASARPQLDRATAEARSRANAAASPAAAVPTPSPAAVAAAKSDAAPLEPTMADVARSAPGALAQRQPAMAETASPRGAQSGVTPASPQRAASTAGQPNVAAPARSLAKAQASAAAAGEGAVAFEAPPSAAASAQPSEAMAQPAATGLTKATGGAPGMTRQRNFDRGLPGEGQLVRTPAAAARRAAASQQVEPGAASSPSEPARIAKARAGEQSSSAALPAEDASIADAAGARQPSRVEASASAAMSRAAASAPRGSVTAAAGNANLDLGPPQIVSKMGEGRTSGGGEPTLGDMRAPARIAKAAAAAAPSNGASQATGAGAADIAATNPSGGPSGDPAMPAVGALARGEQGLPAGRAMNNPASPAASGGAASSLAAGAPARRAEDVPAMTGGAAGPGNIGGGATGTTALARSQASAAMPGDSVAIDATAAMPGGSTPTGATSESTAAARSGPAPGGDGAARQVASLPLGAGAPGAMAPDETAAPGARSTALAGGGLAAPRRANSAADSLPALASAAGAPGALPRGAQSAPAMPAGSAEVDAAALADVSPSDAPLGDDLSAAQADLPAGRMASAGLPVRVAAPTGPGGLSAQPAADIGLPSRRARAESEVVHTAASRMILERSGSKLAADVRVRDTAVPGLRQRDRAMRRELAQQRGGNEGSERAVEMGLDFLARHQNPDGSWSLHDFSQGQPGYENAGFGRMQSDTAATGLSMLAFLGAGYTHTDGKYRMVVGRGLGYLLGNQRADGDLFVPQDARSNLNVWLYSHGIASIALCEAYGMTRDPNLQDPAQRALDFIVAAQNPTEGGWRYAPRLGSDTSVSGWQLMALKSGELAGLHAPSETYQRVQTWLDGAQGQANPALYVYRPKAKQDHQRLPSRVMTAEALLMRQYLGWKRDNATMVAGADYLLGQLPQWTASGAERDAYYWYYGTQFMFQMGGRHWQQWNERLRPLLVDSQQTTGPFAGSWDPRGDTPDRWGREAGRLYITAMHLLMLEVYYRHLPLYRNLDGAGAE